ncbi:hypothetical protein HID58_047716 [Brassica napus]|uniref:Uncharacterized protein n=1 Tax=Brassica napus TaxID=3708 RepID=A0ABQ8B120_BRANA|nr:hypothetical protein HID58_047716 [Brassica napus]
MFLHRRRQDVAIVGGQECEAKSETEEDEELRLIRSLARWSVTEQAAEENDKRRRATQHSAERNEESGGE